MSTLLATSLLLGPVIGAGAAGFIPNRVIGASPVNPAISSTQTCPDLALPPQGTRRLAPSLQCEPRPPTPPSAKDGGAPTPTCARGSLDKEIIQRIIRRHIDQVRKCYNQALISSSDAQGRVVVRFAIDGGGKVRQSCLVTSSLNQLLAERCIVDEILNWEFPKTIGGGWVTVDYPFTLVSANKD